MKKSIASFFGGSKTGTMKKGELSKTQSAPSLGSTTPRNQTSSPRDDNKTYKKSVMMKEGGKIASWKKRMFICKKDFVYYYELPKGFTEADAEYCDEAIFTKELECGSIPLLHAQIVKAENKKYKHCFDITPASTKRVFKIAASSEQEVNEWIACIKPLAAGLYLLDEKPSTPVLQKATSDTHLTKTSDTPFTPQNNFSKSAVDLNTSPSRKSLVRDSDVSSPAVVIASTKPLIPHLSTPDLRRASEAALDSPASTKDSPAVVLNTPILVPNTNTLAEEMKPRDSNASVDAPHENSQVGDDSSKRQPVLTEEDELDIALCAAEIFMKPEQERTPQEQAYVIAMQQYRQQLQDHIKKNKGIPEYSLASGTVIFSIPANERTEVESEFVKEIMECYFEELEKDEERFEIPVELQHSVASRAMQIFATPETERTEEEQAYVLSMNEYARELAKFERKNGLEASHSLISGTLLLPKVSEDQSMQDLEYSYELDVA